MSLAADQIRLRISQLAAILLCPFGVLASSLATATDVADHRERDCSVMHRSRDWWRVAQAQIDAVQAVSCIPLLWVEA